MENPIKMDDLGVPLWKRSYQPTSKLTTHSQPYSNSLWIWPSMIRHFAWIENGRIQVPQSRSPSFKRVSSITTLEVPRTPWCFLMVLDLVALKRCGVCSVEKWLVKIKLAWRDLPFAMATTLKFTKNKSMLSFHQGGKTKGRLSKNPGWSLGVSPFCTPTEEKKKNTVAWKLLLSCRVQILGIWAQVLSAKRPQNSHPP